MPKIADVKSKSRTKRKPLRDVSNGDFKPSMNNSAVMKKSIFDTQQEDPPTTCLRGHPLDRLHLVHSDLSLLIHQIDELVAQALEQKVRNTNAIESFAHVLQEMHTSLKPWVSRFQKVISTNVNKVYENQFETSYASKKIASINEDTIEAFDSPDVYKFDSIVSPSPLVSWHADKKITNDVITKNLNDVIGAKPIGGILFDSVAINTKRTVEDGFLSPEKLVMKKDSIVVSTPYLKMSPPKSCILLEPGSEYCNKNIISTNLKTPRDFKPSCSKASGHLSLKYSEIFGIKTVHKLGNARKVVEVSPKWCISPPKTCILLEPSDDQALTNVVVKDVERMVPMAVSHNAVIESTPMCKDLGTSVLRGKCAGENTLKKELWMRFEAATTREFCVGETAAANKGFLDLLEEVTDDTNAID